MQYFIFYQPFGQSGIIKGRDILVKYKLRLIAVHAHFSCQVKWGACQEYRNANINPT
jgi:hypothetical protein